MFLNNKNNLDLIIIVRNKIHNKVIIRTVFKSWPRLGINSFLARQFATGDKHYGKFKDHLVKNEYKIKGINTKALENHVSTGVENLKGDIEVVYTGTHSSYVKLKDGSLVPSSKVATVDYDGKLKLQYTNDNSAIQATIKKEHLIFNKVIFNKDDKWKFYSEKYQIKKPQMESKQRLFKDEGKLKQDEE